jgi:hypothetical protein
VLLLILPSGLETVLLPAILALIPSASSKKDLRPHMERLWQMDNGQMEILLLPSRSGVSLL